MKCTLKKTSKGGKALRTDTIEGTTRMEKPVVGRPFIMTAAPLDKTKTMRLVTTSHVVRVDKFSFGERTVYEFETETGSVYHFESDLDV